MSLVSTSDAVLGAQQVTGWAFLETGRVPDQVSLAIIIGVGLGAGWAPGRAVLRAGWALAKVLIYRQYCPWS